MIFYICKELKEKEVKKNSVGREIFREIFKIKKTKQGIKKMKKRDFQKSEYLQKVDKGYLSNIIINDLNFLKKEYDHHIYNYYFLVDFLIISEFENEYKSQFIIWFDSEVLKWANVNENDNDQLYNFAYDITDQYIEGIPNITCYRLMLDHELKMFYYQKNGIL